MAEIIIDGSGAVFGRLCSFTAKKALEGSEIVIVNSEKVIITGNKKDTIEKFFGSITVIIDKPFGIGDWVVIEGV